MSILNKRNAVLGWATWQVARRAAKRKAKQAVRTGDGESRRPGKKGALASALAAVGGALWFWRRRQDGGDQD